MKKSYSVSGLTAKRSYRLFIAGLTVLTVFCLVSCTPQDHLTILHTNDTHSQVEPKANNEGGYARRMGLIKEERKKDRHLLLVDAGDFCQGTPYFNFYHGRVELNAMNRMGYDAATIMSLTTDWIPLPRCFKQRNSLSFAPTMTSRAQRWKA